MKKNEEVVEKLEERIVGRTSLHDIYDPSTSDLIVKSGDLITGEIANRIENSAIDQVA